MNVGGGAPGGNMMTMNMQVSTHIQFGSIAPTHVKCVHNRFIFQFSIRFHEL